ncbi:lariat debranching enzyme [Westerdykella ornata]|uniref:Lariat debranching enzyme n=1 Tax=Westerdykella ornata TaxID=318751 RepID=A0A6A6JJU0_WESOR|nr:lariat debranching enzyme [Westerdykella ornata]KAF2276248.1 lariat debranching enzyme [Westerdykella ornata]
MASPGLLATQGLRIAVEGCGHGTLHSIYASVAKACELKQWPGVDLLIIGGDFQAVRSALDLKAVAMPEKYYDMHDFHEYYSGARTAPYLTIFIGGNHEASNYMWELYYGGWVAPRIYYMGAANIIRLGPLRIAGLSGIWKGYNYKKPHYERLPYNQDDIRSIYHVRELDTRKLLQLRSQVDIGLSHDWPRGMEWKGNHRQLFRFKPYFEQEAKDGTLGSVAATAVLERLRPRYWFSAHMHARYSAVWEHQTTEKAASSAPQEESEPPTASNSEEIHLGSMDDAPGASLKNEAEIDLDLDDETLSEPQPSNAASNPSNKNDAEIDLDMSEDDAPAATGTSAATVQTSTEKKNEVPDEIRRLLPESFAPRTSGENVQRLPFPTEITNTTTHFLALDKCLPNRHFLQLLEIPPSEPCDIKRPLHLEYDKEWLAITRVFAKDLQVGDLQAQVPSDKGDAYYRPLIEQEMEWVEENIVKKGKMKIPEDFECTAPVYDASMGIRVDGQPQEYTNPHTRGFCTLLQIDNPFDATDEERAQRMQRGPRPESGSSARGGPGRGGRGGSHRGNRGGRGRGRGGRGRGRW